MSSERLRRFVALSAGLTHARALAWSAEHQLLIELQAGQGEAACVAAAAVLKQCETGEGLRLTVLPVPPTPFFLGRPVLIASKLAL